MIKYLKISILLMVVSAPALCQVNRYQLVQDKDGIILLDSLSGKTWTRQCVSMSKKGECTFREWGSDGSIEGVSTQKEREAYIERAQAVTKKMDEKDD